MSKDFNPFSASQWIAWLGATLMAAISLVAFQFTTFASKEYVKEYKSDLQEAIVRLESKIDRLQESLNERQRR
jgi:hypothetical protein